MPRARLPARLAGGLLAGMLLAVASGGGHALAQDPDATARKLERTRAELAKITSERRKLEDQRGAASRALREADEAVGTAARELADVQRRIAERTQALADLQARRTELDADMARQRERLGALLRAAYVLGEHAPLKLLLAQDRVADGQRLLAYHGYLQRERAQRIEALATQLQDLVALEQRIEAERAALQAAQADHEARVAELAQARKARAGTVAKLDSQYEDRATRAKSLGRDVASLERLLRDLRAAAARAAAREAKPSPAPGASPPAATGPRVGGLGWPVAGTLLAGYGGSMPDGRRSEGVLIAADAGTEVKAAAAGRVVFADWMTGYGLIAIVDHGGDTMSLYAHNDVLLREVGDTVSRGDVIGRVGTSGGQGRPALYFELRRNGKPVDPRGFLQQR